MSDMNYILSRCKVEGDCMIWQGAKHRQGYAHVRVGRKMMSAHRIIGLEIHGDAGDSGVHKFTQTCGNLLCCNPNHIKPTTHSEVCRRSYAKGERLPKSGKRRRLSRDQIIAIRVEPFKYGCNTYLAKKFDTNVTTVRRIRNGESYAWVK